MIYEIAAFRSTKFVVTKERKLLVNLNHLGRNHIRPVTTSFALLDFMPKYTPGLYEPQNLSGTSSPDSLTTLG